jgi:adenine/guanine/hypoxanthine permease
LFGMMTGAGMLLSFVAVDLFKENKIVGGVAIVVALATFFAFIDHPDALIYALGASVLAGIITARFVTFDPIIVDTQREKVRLIPLDGFRFLKDRKVIMGALALLALRTGTSITYSSIDGQMANIEPSVDHTNIISGLSGMLSGLFGGAPVEPIISGTAASPHPVSSAALMMVIMGILLLTGVLPRLVKYIPPSAVAGFLLLLGAVLVIPDNIGGVVTADDPVSGPITVVVTAATFNPFLGMLAGIAMRFVSGLLTGIF